MFFFRGSHKYFRPVLTCISEKVFGRAQNIEALKRQNTPNAILFVKRNNQFQYDYIKENKQTFQNSRFFLYDFDLVNLSHHFVDNPTAKKAVYVTFQHYDLVEPVSKPRLKSVQRQFDPYLEFLNAHTFQIKKSYLDIHPFDAFFKMCRLLDQQLVEIAVKKFYLSFGNEINKNIFYEDVKRFSKETLDQKHQIKLKTYRKKEGAEKLSESELLEKKMSLNKWALEILDKLQEVSFQDQNKQFEWVQKSKFYTETDLYGYLAESKPKVSSYAMFIP